MPKGTLLGPLLFLCHINDLSECVTSKVRLFADDGLLNSHIRNERDTLDLQEDIAALDRWTQKWDMRFNAMKMLHNSYKSKAT